MLTKSMKISKDGLTLKDIDMSKRMAVIAQATYGSLDRDGDKANRGMFTKSWNEGKDDIRLFKNHDKNTGPGKIVDFFEDDRHGYVKAYLGTHTEGEDVLKQLDEGIIVAASFGFIPVKDRQTRIQGKGYDIKEVKWMETSVLTHWGSHQDSGIVSVVKHWTMERLKELSDPEKTFLRQLVNNRQEALMLSINMLPMVAEGSDMYEYINEIIGSQSYDVAYLKRRLMYGCKELNDLHVAVKAMEKFVANTTASDDCIQRVQIELQNTKQLLSDIDTAVTSAPEDSTLTPSASKGDDEFLKQINYSLLKLKVS